MRTLLRQRVDEITLDQDIKITSVDNLGIVGEESMLSRNFKNVFSCYCMSNVKIIYINRDDVRRFFPPQFREHLIENFMTKSRNRILKYIRNLTNKLFSFEKRIEHIDYETLTSVFPLIDDRQKKNIIEGFINSRENHDKGQNIFRLIPSEYNVGVVETKFKGKSRLRHLGRKTRDNLSLKIRKRLNNMSNNFSADVNHKMVESLKQGIFLESEVKKRRKKLRKMGGICKLTIYFSILTSNSAKKYGVDGTG